jgi:hypothetical protein
VFENRVLRIIFGPKRDDVTGQWRNLYNSEQNFSGDKIEKNEVGEACSTYGGEDGLIQGFSGGILKERGHLGDPGVEERVILRWIFRKWDVGVWTGLSWLRIGTGGGHL